MTTTASPRLLLEPRSEPSQAQQSWDPESRVLATTLIRPAHNEEAAPSLARKIDKIHRINQAPYRIVIADMDIEVDALKRLLSFSIRTNPELWDSAAQLPIPREAEPSFLSFDVTYDANQIASFDVPLHIRHDRARGTLGFVFGSLSLVRWGALADDLFVALSADGRLCELRLSGVHLPLQ